MTKQINIGLRFRKIVEGNSTNIILKEMSLGSTENKMIFEFGGQWEIVDHILFITVWSCTNLYLCTLGLFFFYKWHRNIAGDNIKKKSIPLTYQYIP